mgnify:CR=1 FL=1
MNRANTGQPNFAIIGCGLIGRKRLNALGANPPLLYTCDLDAAKAAALAQLAPGCTAVTDYATVLADQEYGPARNRRLRCREAWPRARPPQRGAA